MSHLIRSAALQALLGTPQLVIVDTRFSLQDKAYGRRSHAESHLPGAIYLDLETDLSGPVGPHGGRHPLPEPEVFARRLGAAGIGNASEVVVYDDAGGMYAGRLWWMLRWLGHDAVRVLDGGWQAWQAAGYAVESGTVGRPPQDFVPALRPQMLASRADVAAGVLLVDARSSDRFHGQNETLDPRAGHIPGALNRPFKDNLAGERFKPPETLRAEFAALGLAAGGDKIFYCGSGVTACHNLLAFAEAGLGPARLYAGSWSDWSSYPEAAVEV